MNTLEAKLPRWVLSQAMPLVPWSRGAVRGLKPESELPPKGFELTAEESALFLRLVSECGRLRTHYDVFRWLGGEVQYFLPHEILLSAWGDFEAGDVRLDLTSELPGVRTAQLAHCGLQPLVQQAYGRWADAGRQPVLLKTADMASSQAGVCHCPIHTALRGMRAVLVHGIHDQRSGRDSMFIAFTNGSFTRGRSLVRFLAALDPLVAQIDSAFRKIPALALPEASCACEGAGNVLDLSAREREVLEAVCRGRTNLEIAAALHISPFTVKNHVQRIFRKVGATNRTQAAARYAEAVRQASLALAKRAGEPVQQSA